MLHAPEPIRHIYQRSIGIPTETFTKGWWYGLHGGEPRPRSVAEMVEHRARYGTGGNCFDLAVWLLAELQAAGITARAVGHHLFTHEAHIAVVAEEQYLCDLGDQWLQPVSLVSLPDWVDGFFPGRSIRLRREGERLTVEYLRRDGNLRNQMYDLALLSDEQFTAACLHSARLLRRPFCERLTPHTGVEGYAYWEYDKDQSFWVIDGERMVEGPCLERASWTARVAKHSGMSPAVIDAAWQAYGIT